jgi:hypothetical protein
LNFKIDPDQLTLIINRIEHSIAIMSATKSQVEIFRTDAAIIVLAAKNWLRQQYTKPIPAKSQIPIETVVAASAGLSGMDRTSITIVQDKASGLWKAMIANDWELGYTPEQAIQALGRKLINQLKDKRNEMERVIVESGV